MDPEASKDLRIEALTRAKQHNLDTGVIARETVRMILEEAFAVREPLDLTFWSADRIADYPSSIV